MSPLLQALTGGLIGHAARIMPPAHRPWIRAMRTELSHIPSGPGAVIFAFGCVRASYQQRIIDMLTLVLLSRWVLAVLALGWAIFTAITASLALAVKANPNAMPQDLGHGEDANTEVALRFIQAYPAWELVALVMAAALFTIGAVQLVRRRAGALPLLAVSVVIAAGLAFYDWRLPDPGYNRPLDSIQLIVFWFLCLVPVWWLSRRAPDLHPIR